MPPRSRSRRAVASVLLAFVVLAAVYVVTLVLPDPKRALYNWRANPGGLMFMTGIMFIVYGGPLAVGIYAYLAWREGRRRGK